MSTYTAEGHRAYYAANRERLNARKPKSYTGSYDIARQRFTAFIQLTNDGANTEEALTVLDATFPFPQDSYEQQRLKRGE